MAGRADQRLVFRKAMREDIPRLFSVRNLVRENVLDDPYELFANIGGWFIDAGHCWVVADRYDIQGFAAADVNDGFVEVLYVNPAVHGRGAGRGLLDLCCAALARAGHRSAVLNTQAGSRAELFYRLCGWTEAARSETGAIRFRRDLPPADAVVRPTMAPRPVGP